MGKKKITAKKVPLKIKKKSKKSSVKKSSTAAKSKTSKLSKPSKPSGKKRGRKASTPNRYNTIRSAISEHFIKSVGRQVKRYEIKAIYDWIKGMYATQSVKYIVMNIDIVIDKFYSVYCDLYPVNITNHARFFEWYNFKNYLRDEEKYHYPSDIISVDLSSIGISERFEFNFNDYPSQSEAFYQLMVEAGLKRTSPVPTLYLDKAYCNVDRRCNVYEYILMLDDDNTPLSSGNIDTVAAEDIAISESETPKTQQIPSQPVLSSEQLNLEIEKEKIKQEYMLKQAKMKEFSELLKVKAITFEEYLAAIKSL